MGALFGLAMIAFVIRSFIHLRINKQIHAEDFILLFAVACLCALTGLKYSSLVAQYDLFPELLNGLGGDLAFDVWGEITRTWKVENSEEILEFLVIYLVKLAYLFFFRRLIFRLRNLNNWWWVATSLTIVTGLVSEAAVWWTCPRFSVENLLCEYGL